MRFKLLKKIITFIFAFAIIIAIFNNQNPKVLAETQDPSNPEITEAINNIRFYSSYNYQTLTNDRMQQLSQDFYVPATYGDVSIAWSLNSDYLSLSNTVETIEINTGNGTIFVPVYHITVLKHPSVFKGDQGFTLSGDFTFGSESYSKDYEGVIVPIIPDGFWGGVTYTFIHYFKMFLAGAATTLGLALTGTVIGFFIALFLVLGKTLKIYDSDKKARLAFKILIKKTSSIYITVFRGTPMIVQASFFWYGLGLFGDPLICGLFVVSINTAAYIAEIIRGGIQSIDSGQEEAGLAVGLSHWQIMRHVIFPQAIKNSLPAIGNEFVINIKDTAVLSVIGIFELFNQTRKIAGIHYRQLEAYFVVAVIYLVLTYSVTSVLKHLERRWDMQVLELASSN